MAQVGLSGQDDVYIDNAVSVGDIQAILHRMVLKLTVMEQDIEKNAQGAEQQLAQLRMDVRVLQTAPAPVAPTPHEKRFDLIDTKGMSPTVFGGTRAENFKFWAKKVLAYTNARLPGYRRALEAAEKMGKDTEVTNGTIASWKWDPALDADSKLHDMLLLVTSGEANSIVESVPGRGFESWRLLHARFNAVGEMYTYDKMNAIMKQSPTKHISEIPMAIAKFEKDLKVFRERTDSEFPEVLKLPILIQMIPTAWKREFETQFRTPGSTKTYEALASQLIAIGNEERYNAGKRGPDDMDTDALERAKSESEAAGVEQDYTAEQWDEYYAELEQDVAAKQEEINWLGQKGSKGSRKGGGKGGKGGRNR